MIGSSGGSQMFSDLDALGVRVFVVDVRERDLTADWTVLRGF